MAVDLTEFYKPTIKIPLMFKKKPTQLSQLGNNMFVLICVSSCTQFNKGKRKKAHAQVYLCSKLVADQFSGNVFKS